VLNDLIAGRGRGTHGNITIWFHSDFEDWEPEYKLFQPGEFLISAGWPQVDLPDRADLDYPIPYDEFCDRFRAYLERYYFPKYFLERDEVLGLLDELRRTLGLDEASQTAVGAPPAPADPPARATQPDTAQPAVDDAAVAAKLVGGHHDTRSVPRELLDILHSRRDDPEFAQQLASRLTPSETATLLTTLNQAHQDPAGPPEDFRARHAELLDLLGRTLALGASTLPPVRRNAMTTAWSREITDSPAHATPLSLVVSRGQWPDAFLTGLQNAIDQSERNLQNTPAEPSPPCQAWARAGAPTMTDPGRKDPEGQPLRTTDPMYGLLSAAALNPRWLLANYTGGHPAHLIRLTTGQTITATPVNPRLARLVRDRGLADQATALALAQAASLAAALQTIDKEPRTALDELSDILNTADTDTQDHHDTPPRQDELLNQLRDATDWAVGAGTAAIFLPRYGTLPPGPAAVPIPGPGWLTTGLATLPPGALGLDLILNPQADDYHATIIDGLFLLPVSDGGTVKLIQTTRQQLQALRSGSLTTVADQTIILPGKPPVVAKLDPGLGTRLSQATGATRNGIVGGHNLHHFEQALRDLGLDPAQAITRQTQIRPGVHRIEYQAPRRPDGRPAGPNLPDTAKIVYDPAVITDADMLAHALNAMRVAHQYPPDNPRPTGWAQGIKFCGWIQDGAIASVYPVDPRDQKDNQS
jgi:hypothetical protein